MRPRLIPFLFENIRYQTGWSKSLIGNILKQRKYIGTWVWGEFKHRKQSNGKRITQPADPSDVVRSERPTLAIVSMDLWDAVQRCLEQSRETYGITGDQKKRGPRIHHTSDYPSNMLSGLLFCGVCGSPMHFAGSNSGTYYRCSIAHRKGKAGGTRSCHQRGWVPYDRAVAALSEQLRRELVGCHDWVDDVYAAVVAEYRQQESCLPNELTDTESKLADVVNMVTLIESENASDAILERMRAREAEKRGLESVRDRLMRRKDREEALPDVDWVKAQLANLPGVLDEDPRRAVLFFRKFFGKIHAFTVVAPGKKRGHAEIAFKVSRVTAVIDVIGSNNIDELLLDGTNPAMPEGAEVRIALPGNDKLDKRMPRIDCMVQSGKTWKEIAADLKINKCWANRYYRIWKAAQAEEHGQAV